MGKPKLIILDLSDVLIKGLEGSEKELSRILKIPLNDVERDLFSYDYHDFWISKVSEDETLEDIIKIYKWNISVKTFKSIIRNNFREIEGSRDIIKKVSEQYSTVLLSVNPKEWAEYMRKTFNFDSLFNSGMYFSYQIGYTKRQKESFEFILNKKNVNPEEVLLIDDSNRNLSIARSVGIEGIRFQTPEQLKNDLIRLNIFSS